MRNSNLGLSRMRARRRRLFFIRASIILFFILIIVFGLAILSGNEKVKVQTVLVSGNAAVSTEDILNIVRRDMAGRYWHLFSRSNSILFPRLKVKADILNEITVIRDLDISWENWQTLSIIIEERKPHSVWCGQDIKTPESNCYFVDKYGYIYDQAPSFSGSVYIKNYGSVILTSNDVSQTSYIGNYYLPTDTYIQIFGLIQILGDNGLKIVSVFYDGFDCRFILEVGPEIIINSKEGFELPLKNLLTAIKTKNLDLEKDAATINYIDLRFDNKIVIGKKGE